MEPQDFLSAPALARAAGCSVQTVQNRIKNGTIIPDGWLVFGAMRQPVFRRERLEALRGLMLPVPPHMRGGVPTPLLLT